MKKLNLLGICLMAGLFFTACSDDSNDGPNVPSDASLQLSAHSVSLESENGSGKVEIISNVDWTALKSGNAAWLTVTPSTGTAASDAVTVNFKAEDNTSTAERRAVVRFAHNAGSINDSVVVIQIGQIAEPLRYRDSLALVAFYNETKGYNWSTQWDLEQPLYNWPGVKMDIYEGEHRVTEIELVNNNVVGSVFPDEMRNLTALRSFILTKSTMPAAIPDFIGEWKELQFLALAELGMTGTIPESLYSCTKLYTLHLYGNALTGGISSKIGNLVNMEDLDLGSNNLSGEIPAEIGNLTLLYGLKIDGNQFTSIPATIVNCAKMESFHVANNKIHQEIGTLFDNMAELKVLELGENEFYGTLPALTKCSKLYDLRFSHNTGLTGGLPEVWSQNLPGLQVLQAMECGLTGAIPASYENLSNLESVVLPGNQLEGTLPAFMWNYQYITLNDNKLTGIDPEFIEKCNVIDLVLSNNKLSGDLSDLFKSVSLTTLGLAGMPDVSGQLPTDDETAADDNNFYLAITNLDLSGSNFSGTLPVALFTTKLQSLNLGGCNFSGTLPARIGNASQLATLILKENNFSGSVADEIKAHTNWTLWKAAENICPQRSGVLDNCN